MTEPEYRFAERAAIIEFDGKLPRDEAERLARDELKGAADGQGDSDTKVGCGVAVRASGRDRDDGGGVVHGATRARTEND
jgi:hypothetical protein